MRSKASLGIDRKAIAARVIIYRAEHNINQKDMAQKLEMSNKTLCYLEQCKESVADVTYLVANMKMDKLEGK